MLPKALSCCDSALQAACSAIISSYEAGGKLLICGNGGSAADADHIVGELMKSFEKHHPISLSLAKRLEEFGAAGNYLAENLRAGIPAVNLSAGTALMTAIINDMGADMMFAQQVASLGAARDVLLGISTSGNSKNILYAGITAKAIGMKTIALTGGTGGKMADLFDIVVKAPSNATAEIQDNHSILFHELCRTIENHCWDD